MIVNLIAHGANINWQNPEYYNCSALHVAVLEGRVAACELLIQNSCDVDLVDNNGWTALHHCAALNKVDCAVLLVKRGASLNVTTNDGLVS